MLIHTTGRSGLLMPALVRNLQKQLAGGGDGPLLVIVPEQYTLQGELDLLEALALKGSFRLQVLSPTRLFSRIFAEAGRPARVRIDERGRAMLLYAAMLSEDSLTWYRGAQKKPGFIARALAQIQAFKGAGKTPADVAALAKSEKGALARKLSDIAVLYQSYEQALAGQFQDGEDEAAQAILRMDRARFVRGAQVYFYGFDLYTPTLAALAAALSRAAAGVQVYWALENDETARDAQVYQTVRDSLHRFCRMLAAQGIPFAREALEQGGVREDELSHAARELFAYPPRRYGGPARKIRLIKGLTPMEEAMRVAAHMRALVVGRGYRYRDMAVVCQDDMQYAELLPRACALYGVPLFFQQKRRMTGHPLVRYLLSAMACAARGYRPREMRRLIKSPYSGLSKAQADALFNHQYAHGLRGRAWLTSLEEGGAAEEGRARIMPPLEALRARFRAASSVGEILQALSLLLEEVGAYARLMEEIEELGRRNMHTQATQSAQVWERLMGTLEQLYQLLGGRRLSVGEVEQLLEQGLSDAMVSALPQSGDAVLSGTLMNLKTQRIRALFLVGISDGAGGGEEGLFTAEEAAALPEEVQMVHMSAAQRTDMRHLLLKNAMELPREQLIVSYPQGDMQGGARGEGMLVTLLRDLFPGLSGEGGVSEGLSLALERLSAPKAALIELAPAVRLMAEGRAMNPAEAAAMTLLSGMPRHINEVDRLARALQDGVRSEKLPRALAKRLYGGLASASVSRLEAYAACPFAHFVRYGLRPVVEKPYEIGAGDEGELYHAALEQYARECLLEGEPMPEVAAERMDRVTERILPAWRGDIFSRDAVSRARGSRVREVARRAAWLMAVQLKDSKFRPWGLEIRFGREEAMVTLHPEGGPLSLEGRIDRVDVWRGEDANYVRVIDYKRSAHALSLSQLYYGLNLQLFIYLTGALGAVPEGEAAGVFYFHVDDPVVETESVDEEQIDRERMRRLRLNGFVSGDPEVVRAMSESPEYTLPVSVSESGALRKSSKLLEGRDFEVLMAHALQEAERMAGQIREGDTHIHPARGGEVDACRYCEYRAVCQWDAAMPGAAPRRLVVKDAQVLARLRGEEDEHGVYSETAGGD